MQKTNPEILQITVPAASTLVVDPRNDVKPFNDIRVREAMQMAIDLPTIASTYYGGLVSPEPSTLTSDYLKGWGFPYDQWPQDLKDQYAYNPTAAKQLLADAGYPKGFNTDVVADNSGDMGLLQIVKSYFAAVGINMDIRAMDPASWATFVQTSHKYDQLAFRSIGLLGRSFEPGTQLTLFQTGSSFNYQMISDPVFDAFYAKFMAAISIDDVKQVVKDANEYVAQHHFLISLLPPVGYSLYQPWLKGYNGQYISISAVAGPSLLYFYPARFWIDQNLKKSLGH
jgi:peptide/nickel transport system substrate-binding protein